MQHQINLTNLSAAGVPLRYRFFKAQRQARGIIFFIHGYGTTSGYHDQAINRLNQDYDYYTIELIGHGISFDDEQTNQKVDLNDNVEQICQTIRHLIGTNKFYLIGHSMGGGIAMRVANQMNQQVLAYVSLTPMNSHLLSFGAIRNYFSFAPKNIKTCEKFVNKLTINPLTFRANRSQLFVQEYRYQRYYHQFFKKLKKSMYSWKNQKLCRQNEKQLQVPTLAIAADNDRLISAKSVIKTFKNKPNCQIIVLKDCGHLVFWDQLNQYLDLVLDWFDKH